MCLANGGFCFRKMTDWNPENFFDFGVWDYLLLCQIRPGLHIPTFIPRDPTINAKAKMSRKSLKLNKIDDQELFRNTKRTLWKSKLDDPSSWPQPSLYFCSENLCLLLFGKAHNQYTGLSIVISWVCFSARLYNPALFQLSLSEDQDFLKDSGDDSVAQYLSKLLVFLV